MIEPMKRITVVCLTPDRETTVTHLRELGSIHVVHVRPPESARLLELEQQLTQADRAIGLLQQGKNGKRRQPAPAGAAPPAAAVEAVNRVNAESLVLEETMAGLDRMAKQVEPWGSFSLDTLNACREQGLQMVLCAAPLEHLPVLPAGAVLQPVKVSGDLLYFAVVAPAGIGLEPLPVAALPEITDLAEIQARRQQAATELEAKKRELADLRPALDGLVRFRQNLEREIEFARARDGMGGAGDLEYLQGYLPARRMPELSDAARGHGWALLSSDPDPDDLQVPTFLNLPKWVEPIRVVIDGLGIIPGYREVDISAWFLLFFSLFFAMLIGDAAYGILILLATVLLRRRFPAAPVQPFWLMGILGGATLIWGTLTGTYFGLEPRMLPRLLNRMTVPWLTDPANIQGLCFLIGAIHLTLAHVWNAWLVRRSLKLLGELSWAMVLWGNYFMASQLVLSRPAPPAMLWLYTGGIAGIVLFSAPQRNPVKMIGAGLGKLVLGIVNSFVDLLSYIRLFAVGMAGLTLEQSFLKMAMETGGGHWWTPLVAAAILLVGHLLNIILGSLGVLVHGVRLNVLEFAGHLGLGFTGIRYRPLRGTADNAAGGGAAAAVEMKPISTQQAQ